MWEKKNKRALTERSWWGVGATRCARANPQASKGRGGGAPADMGEITSKHSLKGRGGAPADVGEKSSKHSLKGRGGWLAPPDARERANKHWKVVVGAPQNVQEGTNKH